MDEQSIQVAIFTYLLS